MGRRMIYLFLAVALISSGVIMGGCGGEEKTEPAPVTAPEPAPVPEPEPTPVPEPETTPEKTPPIARITNTQDMINAGESISFSGADSTDADGTITSYKWYFGEGARTASGETATHTYSRCGTYNVELKVTDNDDLSDTTKISIKVVMGVSILIETSGSTWRAGEQPYDIYNQIKKNLGKAGFKVVPQGSDVYDARLLVNYKEKKGGLYTSGDYGTVIECNLKLYDKNQSMILERDISASTPTETWTDLYKSAIFHFDYEVYILYLGEIIASKFGVSDEVSVLIEALKYDIYNTRQSAAEALGKIGDARAVEPLIKALEDKEWEVQKSAAEALGEIGDARAIEPLIKASEDESRWVRDAAQEALEQIGG